MGRMLAFILFSIFWSHVDSSYAHQQSSPNASTDKHFEYVGASHNDGDDKNKDVAWDEFAHRGTMIWACRNIYSGYFVNITYCADKPRFDVVWPDKNVPGNYTGGGMADSTSWPPKTASKKAVPEAPKLN